MHNYLVTVMTWCGLGLALVAAGCSSYYGKRSGFGQILLFDKGEANGAWSGEVQG